MAMKAKNKRSRKRTLWKESQLKSLCSQRRAIATCALCGEAFENFEEATIDHIKPKSLGGIDALHNLQLAHDRCNKKKGSQYPFTKHTT